MLFFIAKEKQAVFIWLFGFHAHSKAWFLRFVFEKGFLSFMAHFPSSLFRLLALLESYCAYLNCLGPSHQQTIKVLVENVFCFWAEEIKEKLVVFSEFTLPKPAASECLIFLVWF